MNDKPGPNGHPDPIREAWSMRFKITAIKDNRVLTDKVCEQLSHCRDDDARRLILGVRDDS